MKNEDKYKVRFMGGPRKIFNIGTKPLPFNVWVAVTKHEYVMLQNIANESKILFEFHSELAAKPEETPKKKSTRKRKKEVKE